MTKVGGVSPTSVHFTQDHLSFWTQDLKLRWALWRSMLSGTLEQPNVRNKDR